MINYDSHVHTDFSTDSETPMEDMVRQGIKIGLAGIVFTDHMDYHFPMKYDWKLSEGMLPFIFDLESYLARITTLKEAYQDTIELLYGVEIGLKTDAIEDNRILSRNKALDYIIGSTHLVDNIDPYYPEYWEAFEEKKGLLHYFETTLQNLNELGDIHIDTLGHLDYIVRYSPSGYRLYSYQLFSDVIDEILHQILRRGISLEINTSGYKNGGPMPNPCEDIIRRYKDMGGELITFGSDAHTTDRLGKQFKEAEKIAKNTGFDYYTTFRNHKPVFHRF